MHSLRLAALLAALALFGGACGEATPSPSRPTSAPVATTSAQPAPRPRAEVTLLYTSDEHGWIAPATAQGKTRGGAAQVLGALRASEGHCPNIDACADVGTLLLSGGDNYTGPAISSYFNGEPMAEALSAMGYSASAFGNHEFDFGRTGFVKNREKARIVYLAANVHASDPALAKDMNLPAFAVFERRGVKIGVVGLATEGTLTAAMASRFEGVAIEPAEPSLDRAVAAAWAANPDLLVLIAHECPDKLAPILERHPDWGLSFVGGGHCHRVIRTEAGGVPVIAPGWRFENYARVRVEVDPARPVRKRVVSLDPQIIEVSSVEGARALPADAALEQKVASWQAKLDEALGGEIGYSAQGLDKDSPELSRWVARAWSEQFGADIAIANKGGMRQALPKGTITEASVYSILPFDNKVVICRVTGRDLIAELDNKEAAAFGVERSGDGYRLSNGAPLDPNRTYTVATTDFMYYGGDHFTFRAHDPAATETGVDWRVPVIAWMKKQKTSAAFPLERLLDERELKASKPRR